MLNAISEERCGGGLSMFDEFSAEKETIDLICAFIRRLRPKLVIECGTYKGVAAVHFARALRSNGAGHLWTIEENPQRVSEARSLLREEKVIRWANIVHGDTKTCDLPDGPYGVVFHDADRNEGPLWKEMERFTLNLEPWGVSFVHDSEFDGHPECLPTVERFAAEHGFTHMRIPSARGLEILQRMPC